MLRHLCIERRELGFCTTVQNHVPTILGALTVLPLGEALRVPDRGAIDGHQAPPSAFRWVAASPDARRGRRLAEKPD